MGDKLNSETARVRVYVDSFNLDCGLRHLSGCRDLWLDLVTMARELLGPGQRLERVTYFTALVRADPPAVERQRAYLAALKAHGADVVLGRFQKQSKGCRECGATWLSYAVKEAHVALASAMIIDVALDEVDVVMLVSADSDFCAPVERIRKIDGLRGTKTRVVTVFPPGKSAEDLRKCSDACFPIDAAVVRRSQFPDVVHGRDGAVYHRPPHWN
ncbi:NYN domain-containing protein [Nonomuraea sp. NEAU-A123]|uniref:NYN domain-containing protein n=1 Tax=Nonomuraea sp. NEAU-A123 TaxID=2839649 RepID=UPI001BE3EAA7|nr:NYN domain-containing protein [Nonomuraea sp. NEAU-A123]MBT2227152.1 NYN domain-containing protein [Nonomuraea sp. NEAU-A123]